MIILVRPLLALAFFFLPLQNFYFQVGFSLKLSQIFLFALFFAVLLSSVGKGKAPAVPRIGFVFFLLVLNSVAIISSSIFSLDVERSTILCIALLICFVAVGLIAYTINGFALADVSVKSYLVASYVTSVYGVLQVVLFLLGYDANVNFNPWDIIPRVPFLSSENYHSNFLIIALCFQFAHTIVLGSNAITLLLIALNLAALFAANSRAAMLALVAAVFFQILLMTRHNFFRVISFAVPVVFFGGLGVVTAWDTIFVRFSTLGGNDGTVLERVRTFQMAYASWLRDPIFGSGLGSAIHLNGHDIHNMFLMLLFEGGVVSIVLYVAMLIFAFLFLLVKFFSLSKEGLTDNWISLGLLGAIFAAFIHGLAEPALYNLHIYFVLGLAFAVAFHKNKDFG